MQTYHIITYGCQMNRADSERVSSVLSSAGLNLAENPEQADVVVVNACSVRQSAINRIWGNLERFDKWKAERPFITILTGCVLPSDKSKFQTRFDAVVPIKEIEMLPSLLNSFNNKVIARSPKQSSFKTIGATTANTKIEDRHARIRLARDDEFTKSCNYFTNQPLTPISQNAVSNNYLNLRPKHLSKFSAFVPIMTGCNAFCTYCAVPYTRGAEENRKTEEIIQEVEDLVMNKGYKEVTLLGQIINKYNVRADDALLKFLEWYQAKRGIKLSFLDDLKTSEKRIFKFHHLLETLGKLPRKFWLRFTSSHPNWFTDELISTIREIPNIPKHFHLPVQAGSDTVLLRMRRPYKIAQYLEFIKKIREAIPLATITTDCIVGFPGETEEEFAESLAVFEAARYDMAFTAQYSPRPDTFAYKNLKDDVPYATKENREKQLNEVLKRTAHENNQRLVGTTWDVLIHSILPLKVRGSAEGVMNQENHNSPQPSLSLREGGERRLFYHGISENFKNVHVESDRDLPIGKFVSVTFTEANPWSLKGKAIYPPLPLPRGDQ